MRGLTRGGDRRPRPHCRRRAAAAGARCATRGCECGDRRGRTDHHRLGAAGLLGYHQRGRRPGAKPESSDDTLLVDANVHAPSVGDLLNVPLGGLLTACLSVDRGTPKIAGVAVSTRLHVLSGVDPAVCPAVHPGRCSRSCRPRAGQFGHILLDVDGAIDPAGRSAWCPTGPRLQRWDYGPPIVVIVVGSLRWPSSGCGAACLLRPI